MTPNSAPEAVVSRYGDWMASRYLSPETIRTARYVLGALSRWAGGPILYLSAADLSRWQPHRARQITAPSLRNEISYLRGFYRWATREGLLSGDPSTVLDLPRAPRRLPRPIEDMALAEAMAGAPGEVRAALGLAAFAGLRACEIARLDWAEVTLDGEGPHLRVVGKGGHERVVDIAPALAEILGRPGRGPVVRRLDGAAGPNRPARVSQLVNDHLHGLGLAETLHCARHRFGTAVYAASGDIRATQEAMGHASPTTTAGYAAVSRRNVREAVLAAGTLRAG